MNLQRFLDAQETIYDKALGEIRSARKTGHWMWFIFPQYKGLGFSETSVYYAISDKDEATAYLHHPVLGARLKEITHALLQLDTSDAARIFGSPDDLKLKSCMTLFAEIETSRDNVFQKVIDRFFEGVPDTVTLNLLKHA